MNLIARRIEAWLSACCGAVLAVLLALTIATTVQRYVLGSGFVGAEEAAVWLLVLLVCLGFPLVGEGATAMRVDLFGGRAVRFRSVVAEAFVLAAAIVLVFSGTQAALQVGGTSPLLGLGEWMKPAALAGSGALALTIRLLKAGDRSADLTISTVVALLAVALVVAGIKTSIIAPSTAALLVIGLGIAAGAPLPHIFVLAGFGAITFGSPLVPPAVSLSVIGGLERHLLLAIPFFLLTGALLVVSGRAADLIRFASALVGARRSGTGQTVLATSVLFSGVSGSSIANAAFSARTFFQPLVASGYSPERAGAIIAATAVLDNIIPPSIAFFILATATNLPVGPLLVAGLGAGLLLAAALAVTIAVTADTVVSAPKQDAVSLPGLALRAAPVFGLGLIVVLGIRLGVVTPTEAAGVAAAYTLVAALLAAGRGSGIFAVFRQAGVETAAILMLIGASAPLAFLLAVDGVAAGATRAVLALGENPYVVVIIANLLLLVAGLVLDIGAAILLFGPILLPVVIAVGIDPVFFGAILVVNLMIGGLTPPVGILVQVTSAVTGVTSVRIFRALLPYLAALLIALLVMSLGAAVQAHFTKP